MVRVQEASSIKIESTPLKERAKHPTVEKTKEVSKSRFKEFFTTIANKICHFFKAVFCINNDLSDLDPITAEEEKSDETLKTDTVGKKVKFASQLIVDEPKVKAEPKEKPLLPPSKQETSNDKISASLLAKLHAIEEERRQKRPASGGKALNQASSKKPLTREELKEKAAKEKAERIRAQEAAKARARTACLRSLTQFCSELDLSVPNNQLLGLPQIGNNCYMNAGIQLLNIYAENHPGFLELLALPLVPKEGQSLMDFEEKVLSQWTPLAAENYDTEESYSDAILFKWSFLALCQAKMFGNSEAVGVALRSHHSLCFDLGLLSDFFRGRYSQKDVGDYIVLWHQTLRWRPLKKLDQNYCTHKGMLIQNPIVKTRESFLQIPMSRESISDKALEKIEKKQNKIRAQYSKLIDKKDNEIESLARNQNKNKKKLAKCNQDKVQLLEQLQGKLAECEEKIRNKTPFQCDLLLNDFFSNAENMSDVGFILPEGERITPEHSLRNTKLGMPLPSAFLTQFKRFYQNELESGKIRNPIEFNGLELDVSSFVKEDLPEEISYQLTGFVVHIGSMNSGHYVAYVKKEDTWYKCNDGTVSTVKGNQLAEVLRDAYFCCYGRA